ncbi:transcriptional regulator [Pararhizobium sp. DWP3-4]|uniref:transcriptional regulator n=1 Tax=unclassified Pararhizobium TaxID=2643050 RepID=UPI003CE7F2F6
MKKIQRSFAVEYKNGRRKPDARSNSIWGNMDLKSVALAMEEETMLLPDAQLARTSDGEISPSNAKPAVFSLTPPIGQNKTVAVIEETTMADEIDTITTEAPAVAETPVVPKKQRKPRATKATLEAVSVEVAAEPSIVSGKQKRGRKGKPVDNAGAVKRAPVKRSPKAVQTMPAVLTPAEAAGDEMTDILQLEEENQRLRKRLAEKLRTENADLRKRLNLD